VQDTVKLGRETIFFLAANLVQTKKEGVTVLSCFCSFVGTELLTRSWRPSHDCGWSNRVDSNQGSHHFANWGVKHTPTASFQSFFSVQTISTLTNDYCIFQHAPWGQAQNLTLMFWRVMCTLIVCKKLKRWIKMVEVEAGLLIEDDWNELTLWSDHEIGAIWWGGLCICWPLTQVAKMTSIPYHL
jgi:hypothetical protein